MLEKKIAGKELAPFLREEGRFRGKEKNASQRGGGKREKECYLERDSLGGDMLLGNGRGQGGKGRKQNVRGTVNFKKGRKTRETSGARGGKINKGVKRYCIGKKQRRGIGGST